jgi:hypothetical protein
MVFSNPVGMVDVAFRPDSIGLVGVVLLALSLLNAGATMSIWMTCIEAVRALSAVVTKILADGISEAFGVDFVGFRNPGNGSQTLLPVRCNGHVGRDISSHAISFYPAKIAGRFAGLPALNLLNSPDYPYMVAPTAMTVNRHQGGYRCAAVVKAGF